MSQKPVRRVKPVVQLSDAEAAAFRAAVRPVNDELSLILAQAPGQKSVEFVSDDVISEQDRLTAAVMNIEKKLA